MQGSGISMESARSEGADTTCSSLLRELQNIWDEMGETDDERDRMLLQLEQECLDVYRRKVDQANCARARLHQLLADSESELASLQSLLGDRPCMIEKRSGTLRQQLVSVTPQIECLQLRKEERTKQFEEVQHQIQTIAQEISPGKPEEAEERSFPEKDLSMWKLHELHSQLQELQNEKNSRLNKVSELLNVLEGFCVLLGANYSEVVKEVHPSLCGSAERRSVSNETLGRLSNAIENMIEEKRKRMEQLRHLVARLKELWDLMDTPFEERQPFRHLTRTLVATEHELSEPACLSLETITKAELEVERLDQLKISRMKELVLQKHAELQETCTTAHLECDPTLTKEKVTNSLDSDLSELLATIERSIDEANKELLSRKDIMERIEKWMSACEEESWLEEYNKDESRFNATKGAHLNLKRAEKARIIVAKLPTMLESLKSKTRSWEDERGRVFLYNGVSLLAMLDEYSLLRREKEEEKRRMREEKRAQEQHQTEQELLYGTKPMRKGQGGGARANGRLSLLPEFLPPPKPASVKSGGSSSSSSSRPKRYAPPLLNYVALPKDGEASSVTSGGSAPGSPVAA